MRYVHECLLAMLILMLVILMLILLLVNMNTGYADTDADLCIRSMSLCCITPLGKMAWSFFWTNINKITFLQRVEIGPVFRNDRDIVNCVFTSIVFFANALESLFDNNTLLWVSIWPNMREMALALKYFNESLVFWGRQFHQSF